MGCTRRIVLRVRDSAAAHTHPLCWSCPIPPQCPVCRQGIERTYVCAVDEFRVTVQTFRCEKFEVIAASSDTVWDLKTKIYEQQGPVPSKQRLFYFARELLDDGRTLAFYNIQKESTISLIAPFDTAPWTTPKRTQAVFPLRW
jgi:large subunit ribosomal protein L40e